MLKPSSTTTRNLIAARELIADERNWCQWNAELGERRCAVGALRSVHGLPNKSTDTTETTAVWLLPEYEPLKEAGRELFGTPNPATVNDRLGHAATLRMFDRAIELSLQEE